MENTENSQSESDKTPTPPINITEQSHASMKDSDKVEAALNSGGFEKESSNSAEIESVVNKADAASDSMSDDTETDGKILFKIAPNNRSAEEQAIVENAKADGTFMKAPNGEQSNLNEKQWVQVRTKAFKDWFGDWELMSKQVPILNTESHQFKDSKEAKEWAVENGIAGDFENKTIGKYEITKTAIDKYLHNSSVSNSDNRELHHSVLRILPQVIDNSIIGEVHADYNKGKDGIRGAENGINPDVTINRLFGAVEIDGKIYRVKTTLKEYKGVNQNAKPYTYEVTKIELIDGKLANAENSTDPNINSNSITGANLLQGVEKSYEKGVNLINSSKVVDENGEPMVVYHGTIKGGFSTFKKGEYGIWFSNEDVAGDYGYETDDEGDPIRITPDDGKRDNTVQGFWEQGVYPVFLNIRTPKVVDFEGKGAIENNITPDEYLENLPKENDGLIIENVKDYAEPMGGTTNYYRDPHSTYAVSSPNQIKSATDNVGTFDEGSNDIRFRVEENKFRSEELSKPYKGKVPMSDIDKAAADLRAEFGDNQIYTVQDSSELPPHIARQVKKAGGKVQGIFDAATGQVFIVGENINNKEEVRAIVLHELLAHKGLRNVFGENEKLDKVLQGVYDGMSEVDKENLRQLYGDDQLLIAEEYIASLAERYKKPSTLKRMVAKVRELVREVFGIDYSYNDIMSILARSERGFQMQAKPSKESYSSSEDYLNAVVEYNTGEPLNEVRYRAVEVNRVFNENLDMLIKGDLEDGFVFDMGMPSDALLMGGLPNLPIELSAERLERKSKQDNHEFKLSNLKNL
ncbi:MAG: hypothetical protein ACK5LR_01900, partial [Mangrovibacterium sp.]